MIVTVGLGLFFCDEVRAEVGKAIPLWQGEVPGEKGDIPAESSEVGGGIRRVSNVSIPTITVYPAPGEKRNGAAVLVCPGGGYNI